MTGISTSCGACKFLRRKCTSECVFGPYFSYNEATSHFAAVHKVFGASNVTRLLLHLPEQFRSEAALSITYEALARMRDPVYGCVAYIYALQQEVANLQEEIEVLGNQMANASIVDSSSTTEFWGSSQETNNNFVMNDPLYISPSLDENPMMDLQEYWTNSPLNYDHQQQYLLQMPHDHHQQQQQQEEHFFNNDGGHGTIFSACDCQLELYGTSFQ